MFINFLIFESGKKSANISLLYIYFICNVILLGARYIVWAKHKTKKQKIKKYFPSNSILKKILLK